MISKLKVPAKWVKKKLIENRQFSFLICVNSLGGCGRCHWNTHILLHFLLYRKTWRRIQLLLFAQLSHFWSAKQDISYKSWTQGKWMRNFRRNFLSQPVILLLVWLVSGLSELFLTPYLIRNISKLWIFPKIPQCYM